MTDKQLFQLQNIMETLLEATEHLSSLVKKRELNQSIYAFSSIVEGSQAIIPALNALDNDFIKQSQRLEHNLTLIAEHLENGNLVKIAEILQFSLHPSFIRMVDTFTEKYGNQKDEKHIHIGVFHSWANPKEFTPKERLDAMVDESVKQDSVLYFFTSDDIDFDNEEITADTFNNDQWTRVTVPFPDVISNVGAGKRSQAERRLSRMIPFTHFNVGNKYTLPKRIAKHRKYAELLVPFTVCTDQAIVDRFMEKNNQVVFKSLGSNRGEKIYFVTKKGSRYIMLDQKKERIMGSDDFQQFVEHTILGEKNGYIIQKYIHTRTKADEPYHFRAHVQKNGTGKWQLTHIYPRIGHKKSNLSNIRTEGRVEDFPAFLSHEYGNKQGKEYETKILQLSVDVAIHLDKLYGFTISELGLDFAIDDNGRIWMHEANNGPQTAFHEEKRAKYLIAYAKYIAENGVMYSTTHTQQAFNQFQAQHSLLPYVDKHTISIGMMTGKEINMELTTALHEEARQSAYSFYHFRPADIDFERELIKAHVFEDGEWVPKIAAYPDVIIDYAKLRGYADTKYIYEELQDIPFTNNWPFYNISRSAVYDEVLQNEQTVCNFAPYENVRQPYDVIRFMKRHGNTILKQRETSGYSIYTLGKSSDQSYTVTANDITKSYHENSLKNYINELIKEKHYIMQKDLSGNNGDAKQVDLHLMLDAEKTWQVIIGSEQVPEHVTDTATHIAANLAARHEGLISEMAIKLILTEDQIIMLQDIDLNGIIPGEFTIHEPAAIAKATIDYSTSLLD